MRREVCSTTATSEKASGRTGKEDRRRQADGTEEKSRADRRTARRATAAPRAQRRPKSTCSARPVEGCRRRPDSSKGPTARETGAVRSAASLTRLPQAHKTVGTSPGRRPPHCSAGSCCSRSTAATKEHLSARPVVGCRRRPDSSEGPTARVTGAVHRAASLTRLPQARKTV